MNIEQHSCDAKSWQTQMNLFAICEALMMGIYVAVRKDGEIVYLGSRFTFNIHGIFQTYKAVGFWDLRKSVNI